MLVIAFLNIDFREFFLLKIDNLFIPFKNINKRPGILFNLGYNQKINFYKGIYELSYRGNIKILNICNLLYNNANIYMDRKYNNYLILKNRYNGWWVPN